MPLAFPKAIMQTHTQQKQKQKSKQKSKQKPQQLPDFLKSLNAEDMCAFPTLELTVGIRQSNEPAPAWVAPAILFIIELA